MGKGSGTVIFSSSVVVGHGHGDVVEELLKEGRVEGSWEVYKKCLDGLTRKICSVESSNGIDFRK